jgi:hypothetical protein
MSTQLSLRQVNEDNEVADSCCSSSHRRVSYSNSQLTRAVDATFSMRQDEGLERPDHLARTSNPLGSDRHRLQLKKRKCNFIDRPTAPKMTADFLSGIFQDLADVRKDQNCGGISPEFDSFYISPDATEVADDDSLEQSPCKKSRLSRTLSRCTKSFANIEEAQHVESDQGSSFNPGSTKRLQDLCSFDAHPVSSDTNAANMVDHIFSDSITNLHFPDLPCLPVTVSASSCSSNNLTQTPVNASQVFETKQIHVEGDEQEGNLKDGYGWFVEMEEEKVRDRLQAVAAATEDCRAISSPEEGNLTFAACGPKKSVHLDSEVEWAKAADTVDDVLGGILF